MVVCKIVYSIAMFLPQIFLLCIFIAQKWIETKKPRGFIEKYYIDYIEKSYKKSTWSDKMLIICKYVCGYDIFSLVALVIGYVIYQMQFLGAANIISELSQCLQNDLLTWFGGILTICVVLVAFQKDYYLVFSYRDVVASYGFYSQILEVAVAVLISKGILILQNVWSIEKMASLVLNIINVGLEFRVYWLIIKLFYKVIKLIFSKDQEELKLLNNLHFRSEQRICQITLHDEEVSDHAILVNVEYLFDQYVKTIRRVNEKEFKNFELYSVYGEYEKRAYKNIVKMLQKGFIIWGIGVEFFWLFILKFLFNGWWRLIIGIGIILAVIFSCYYLKCIGKKEGQCVARCLLNRLVLHDYVIQYKVEEKTNIIAIEGMGPFKKDSEFIKVIVNMIIFYKILSESKIRMKRVLDQLESLYTYHKEINTSDNKWFYFITIYYSFLYYWELSDKGRKRFVREIRGKDWLIYLEKEEMISLVKTIIKYTEKGAKANKGINVFDQYVKKVLCAI